MSSPVRFAQTADGVRVAYLEAGAGSPLICMPGVPFNHLELEWDFPEWRQWHERLAESVRLIRYDSRGTGLSDREPFDLSLDALLMDLDAIVERAGPEPVTLFTLYFASPIALAYAALHPDRVKGLIIWAGFAKGIDFAGQDERTAAFVSLFEQDWVLFTETLAHQRLGWALGPTAQRFGRFLRGVLAPERMKSAMLQLFALDASGSLGKIRARALVLHRRELAFLSVTQAQQLASSLTNGELQLLEGTSSAPFLGDAESVAAAVVAFVAEVNGTEPIRPVDPLRIPEPLSPREEEVLRLIAGGRSNNEIAGDLVISIATVKTHVNNLYAKLGVGSRTQALRRGREIGLLD